VDVDDDDGCMILSGRVWMDVALVPFFGIIGADDGRDAIFSRVGIDGGLR
jgi:hypothetical protein